MSHHLRTSSSVTLHPSSSSPSSSPKSDNPSTNIINHHLLQPNMNPLPTSFSSSNFHCHHLQLHFLFPSCSCFIISITSLSFTHSSFSLIFLFILHHLLIPPILLFHLHHFHTTRPETLIKSSNLLVSSPSSFNKKLQNTTVACNKPSISNSKSSPIHRRLTPLLQPSSSPQPLLPLNFSCLSNPQKQLQIIISIHLPSSMAKTKYALHHQLIATHPTSKQKIISASSSLSTTPTLIFVFFFLPSPSSL